MKTNIVAEVHNGRVVYYAETQDAQGRIVERRRVSAREAFAA